MRKLLILTNFDFENRQGAAYSRMINYLKALEKEAWEIEVYSSFYQYNSKVERIKLSENAFACSGISRNISAIKEDFDFKGYRAFLDEAIVRFPQPDIIWLYNKITYPAVKTVLAKAKRIKCKTVTEKNELETALAINYSLQSGNPIKSFVFQFLKSQKKAKAGKSDKAAFQFDGIIAISHRLEDYYKQHPNVLRVPILVDTEAAPRKTKEQKYKPGDTFKIGYFGQISEQKDGVFSLIKSVKALAEHYSIECHLYGPATESVKRDLQSYLDSEYIQYHGSIAGSEVAGLLPNYNLLALIRPFNPQTDYGFSTKLGEYLGSGSAVIATAISDNAVYLEDGLSAYLLPGQEVINQEQLQRKLEDLIQNAESIDAVGAQGRVVAQENFDFRCYNKVLSDYLNRLVES